MTFDWSFVQWAGLALTLLACAVMPSAWWTRRPARKQLRSSDIQPRSDFPEPALYSVLSCLDGLELARASSVASTWNRVATSSRLWTKLLPESAAKPPATHPAIDTARMGLLPAAGDNAFTLESVVEKGLLQQSATVKPPAAATAAPRAAAAAVDLPAEANRQGGAKAVWRDIHASKVQARQQSIEQQRVRNHAIHARRILPRSRSVCLFGPNFPVPP